MLRVIVGPTAAGKSALALRLAERLGGTIISADSRQVYRGFDIGTAKPDAGERRRVPHEGIDVADPAERFSAARWAGQARGWIARAADAGRTPLVVGGTGFYVRALAEPLFREPTIDPARRAALASVLEALPVAELRRWCDQLDPARAHLGRSQLLRAVEVALLTGQRLSHLHTRGSAEPGLAARYLVVDPGPVLGEWIAARVHRMLASGWVEETRALAARVPLDAPAWGASGYATVRRVAVGEVELGRAAEAVTIETRQYAKRQRTWFRHQLPAGRVTRVDPTAPDALAQAEAWWHGTESKEAA